MNSEMKSEPPGNQLTADRLQSYFRQANVTAFASTHTCSAGALDLTVDGSQRVVINNGSAGLPNFKGDLRGLITRISVHSGRPSNSLYGLALDDIRFDAIPVEIDGDRWQKRFLSNWPPQSPAHQSYFERITQGPAFSVEKAKLGQFH